MADTFKITGYNAGTQTVTVDINLDPRTNFAGGLFTGVKIQNPPTDTVANVSAFFRKYADAYIAGQQSDTVKQAAIAAPVAALLNVATNF